MFFMSAVKGLCRKAEKVRMHVFPSSLAIGGLSFSVTFANLIDVKLGVFAASGSLHSSRVPSCFSLTVLLLSQEPGLLSKTKKLCVDEAPFSGTFLPGWRACTLTNLFAQPGS